MGGIHGTMVATRNGVLERQPRECGSTTRVHGNENGNAKCGCMFAMGLANLACTNKMRWVGGKVDFGNVYKKEYSFTLP